MRRLLLSVLLLAVAAPALAQQKDPLPWYVGDLRGVWIPLDDDITTAQSLDVTLADLPGRAFGGVGGFHLYPIRRGGFAVGVGGEFLVARGSRQNFDPNTDDALGPEVHRLVQGYSGQVSLNFGSRQGWSYLTAGAGPFYYDTYLGEDLPDGPAKLTTNFGFGGRWFNSEHFAFTADLRFYLTPASPRGLYSGARNAQTLAVVSVGLSVK